MKRVLFFIFVMFVSQNIFAGSQSGKVVSLRVSSKTVGNPTHVRLDGVWNNKPACAVNGWWAIDTDTAAGKSLLSILLTAHTTGKKISIWGTNLCDLRGDMETAFQVGL